MKVVLKQSFKIGTDILRYVTLCKEIDMPFMPQLGIYIVTKPCFAARQVSYGTWDAETERAEAYFCEKTYGSPKKKRKVQLAETLRFEADIEEYKKHGWTEEA
jgi:hypothetical protein